MEGNQWTRQKDHPQCGRESNCQQPKPRNAPPCRRTSGRLNSRKSIPENGQSSRSQAKHRLGRSSERDMATSAIAGILAPPPYGCRARSRTSISFLLNYHLVAAPYKTREALATRAITACHRSIRFRKSRTAKQAATMANTGARTKNMSIGNTSYPHADCQRRPSNNERHPATASIRESAIFIAPSRIQPDNCEVSARPSLGTGSARGCMSEGVPDTALPLGDGGSERLISPTGRRRIGS